MRSFLRKNKRNGFTLIEAVIYVAILAVAFTIVVGSLIRMTSAYGRLRDAQNIQNAAITALDRMTRELRDAESIVLASSSFGSHPGRLTLQTTDASSTPRTVEFYMDGNVLKMKENGVDQGPIMRPNVVLSSLIFRHATTTVSDAVKVELTFVAGTSTSVRTENFYTTVILRNSY